MTSTIAYPLVVFYDAASPECAEKSVALEAAYRAAWGG